MDELETVYLAEEAKQVNETSSVKVAIQCTKQDIYHLISKHEDSLQRKLAVAIAKEILKARTKQIHD